MQDLISRQSAIELVRDVCDAIMSGCESWYDPEIENEVYKDTREVDAILKCKKEVRIALRNMPSAQPKRKAGHWEFQGDRMFMCTCCCYLASQEQLESWRVKKTDSAFPLFCPNCGARMEEPEDIPMEYFEGGGR